MAGTIVVNGFSITEAQGSGEYDISSDGITATRKFTIDSNRALEFALSLKGHYKQYGDFLLQVLPSKHPILPDLLYVERVNIRPFAGSKSTVGPNNMIYYDLNTVEVTYTVPRSDDQQRDEQNDLGIWFTEDIDYSVEVLVIPGGKDNGLEFDEGAQPIRPLKPGEVAVPAPALPVPFGRQDKLVTPRKRKLVAPPIPPERYLEEGMKGIPLREVANEPPVIISPQQEGEDDDEDEEEDIESVKQDVNVFIGSEDISLDFPVAVRWNRSAIRALRGKVNSDSFLEAAPGHLLFEGARSRREIDVAGRTQSRSLTLLLKWRQYNWNSEWKPKTKKRPIAGWTRIIPPLYSSKNFTTGIRAIFQ